MILKGQVSTADNINRKARIILPDMENIITPEISVAQNVGLLEINDMVVVAVFSDSLADGIVIAKY